MPHWLSESPELANHPVPGFDEKADRQLRLMDIALALLALTVLALPLGLAFLVGRSTFTPWLGRDNQVFQRWHIVFPGHMAGRFFERLGMGQWPVLFNILRGQLAWVGHTPLKAQSAHGYPAALLKVRPGLTGIWSMRQRTAVDFGTEEDANMEYVRKRSLRHDSALLLRTLAVWWMPAARHASASRICVGDVSFDNLSMDQAVERIAAMLNGSTAQQVSFVNPACVNIAANDRGYRRLLGRAAMVLPDGIGIKIAADLLGVPLRQNVNGTDLFPRLCELFEKRGARVFLLGGQPGVAERVAHVIAGRWPQLQIVGMRHGFFSVAQEGEVAAEVCASQADVVLVARGVPMQDVFIDRHLHQLGVKVAIGVGGLFDFVSGRIPRAPLWMRDSGLEWIYRLIQEPSRMWRRYLLGNFTFMGRIVLQRLGMRTRAADGADGADGAGAGQPLQGRQDAGAAEVPGLRAVLFATSTATTQAPVAHDFPLALLPWGWTTFVEHAIEQLAVHGVRDIDLVVSSRPEELRRVLGLGERWGVRLRWHLSKSATTPYGIFGSTGFSDGQRVLVGHADRLVGDEVLAALIAADQMAATVHEQTGMVWSGWGSTTAETLRKPNRHSDEASLGHFLCQQTRRLYVLEPGEFVQVGSAAQLLQAQQRTLAPEAMDKVPATWLRTPWGAHSPDAIVDPDATIEGPVLIGPGCLVAAGATLGSGTVLTRDVVIASGASVHNSLVFPHTFVGQGLELDTSVVNGRSVHNVRLDVRIALPPSDGLLLDLQASGAGQVAWFSRLTAAMLCLAFLPWLAMDAGLRRLRDQAPRWSKRQVAVGWNADTAELRLKTLRCANPGTGLAHHILSHFGEWLDVLEGQRTWFGSRPRSQSQWYALGRDWQSVLAGTTIGCLHAPAWSEGGDPSLESMAAADVFYAVNQSMLARLRILRSACRWH